MKNLAILIVSVGLWAATYSHATALVAYVTYHQPAVVAPAPPVYYTSYYAAPAPVPTYQPVARVRTRYRPILGSTVTRIRYRYAPRYSTYYAPTPVVYGY